MNLDLRSLAEKDVSTAIINIENKGLSQNDFLDSLNEAVESPGYEIHRICNEDLKNPNWYGVSIEKKYGGNKDA